MKGGRIELFDLCFRFVVYLAFFRYLFRYSMHFVDCYALGDAESSERLRRREGRRGKGEERG